MIPDKRWLTVWELSLLWFLAPEGNMECSATGNFTVKNEWCATWLYLPWKKDATKHGRIPIFGPRFGARTNTRQVFVFAF